MNKDQLVIKPKRAKGDDGHKIFSIRVRDDIVGQLDRIAAETGRSRNELIGILLEYALKNCIIETDED